MAATVTKVDRNGTSIAVETGADGETPVSPNNPKEKAPALPNPDLRDPNAHTFVDWDDYPLPVA